MRRKITLAAFAMLAAVALSGASAPQTTDPDIPPRKRARLVEWLESGTYRETYVSEPAVHQSAGPHGGNVRTYFNSILAEDLREGRTTFRKGATMVKELYFGGTDEVAGYAVMTKVKKKSGGTGKGWLFYEAFNRTGDDAFYGRGLRLCSDCHSAGTDFLLSPFRPQLNSRG